MPDRPDVVVSCCVSLDGYLDDASDTRLVLSGPEDLARVDALRASCDAVLVGAETVRRDNPRLLVRGEGRSPVKVTMTRTGDLDTDAAFFRTGDVQKLVYAPARVLPTLQDLPATVVAADSLDAMLADLCTRGLGRLLVEGGRSLLTQFLTAGLVDELHLAVAPIFVGDSRAPRFVGDGAYPFSSPNRARLVEVGTCGDTAVLRYALSASNSRGSHDQSGTSVDPNPGPTADPAGLRPLGDGPGGHVRGAGRR